MDHAPSQQFGGEMHVAVVFQRLKFSNNSTCSDNSVQFLLFMKESCTYFPIIPPNLVLMATIGPGPTNYFAFPYHNS